MVQQIPELNEPLPLFDGSCSIPDLELINVNLEVRYHPASGLIRGSITTSDESIFSKLKSNWSQKIKIPNLSAQLHAFFLLGHAEGIDGRFSIPVLIPGNHLIDPGRLNHSATSYLYNGFSDIVLPAVHGAQFDSWIIDIVPLTDYADRRQKFQQVGGTSISHEIRIKRGDSKEFHIQDTQELLELLEAFLTFLFCRRVSANIVTGRDAQDAPAQALWATGHPNTSAHARSWAPPLSSDTASNLLVQFSDAWSANTELLRRLVKWHSDCVPIGASKENCLILGQAALESAFHHIFVTEKGIFNKGESAEKLPASDRIRLLLDHLRVDFRIPSSCRAFDSAAKAMNWADVPHALTDIRNKIVHPRKFDSLTTVPERAFAEVIELVLEYLELSILRCLGYKGFYRNRSQMKPTETEVPWK
tara:strand:+ start:60 stop:1313 length:1254 start_codon:yes stop_codon:yes gene_type:complete